MLASEDGKTLYATVGSNSNAGENGMAAEQGRAAIWEIDAATGQHRIFAGGIRNPNGMAWEPATKTLWTVTNERDELGGDLVPDYLTSVQFGGFYGWPWNYWGDHVDTRVKEPQTPELEVVTNARLRARLAHRPPRPHLRDRRGARPPLRQRRVHRPAWLVEPQAPRRLQGDVRALRRRQAVGPAGRGAGAASSMPRAKAQGRPVGVTIDGRAAALLVADDVGGKVWRVSAPGVQQAARRSPPAPTR